MNSMRKKRGVIISTPLLSALKSITVSLHQPLNPYSLKV